MYSHFENLKQKLIEALLLHLTGKDFDLDTNPMKAELTQSETAVKIHGVQINYLNAREGDKSFILEITNVTFLQKQGQKLPLDEEVNNCLFVHRNLSQTEVVIVNDDGMYVRIMCTYIVCMCAHVSLLAYLPICSYVFLSFCLSVCMYSVCLRLCVF